VRRNLTTALDAVLQVRRLPHPVTLVCAGVDRGEGGPLAARARDASDPAAIVLTGPVSEAALVNLYRGASLLVYPSRYEGFGLPLLEAMQCGIPVVGADASSIPEIAGDAGVLLPPLLVDAWAAAILSILEDAAVAARMAERSVRQAALFTWDRTARETLRLFRGLAGRRP